MDWARDERLIWARQAGLGKEEGWTGRERKGGFVRGKAGLGEKGGWTGRGREGYCRLETRGPLDRRGSRWTKRGREDSMDWAREGRLDWARKRWEDWGWRKGWTEVGGKTGVRLEERLD